MNKLIIDIETIPNQNLSDELKPKFDSSTLKMGNIKDPIKAQEKIMEAEKKFEEGLTKTMSIQSNFCQIISLGYIEIDEFNKEIKQDVFLDSENDESIIKNFESIYQGHTIIGWNCKGFDIPIIWKRSILNGIGSLFQDYRKLCAPYQDNGCIDLMHVFNGNREYGKLIECAALLGIPAKEGMDGSQIYDAFKDGKFDEIKNYNMQDCEATLAIYKKIC